MSADLKTQIEDCTRFFVSDVPPVDIEEILTRTLEATEALAPLAPRRKLPGWAYALVAAGLVLLLGGLALFGPSSGEPAPPVTQPETLLSNGWIAYSASDPGEDNILASFSSIFITRAGESPSRIFGAPGDGVDQTCPTFSPDGTKLAYAEAETEVVVVAFDGSYDELLRFKVTPVNGGCITWSPDSSLVAYPLGTGPIQIGALDGETHILEGLYGDGGLYRGVVPWAYADLAWSPDGSSIAGVSGAHLFEVPLDGGEPVQLASNAHWDAPSLAWSPDGSLMAIRWHTSESPQTIHIIAADGGEVRSFEANQGNQWYDNHSDAWSPDGTRLAYLDRAQGSIAVLDPETGDVTHLALNPLRHSLQAGPIWSADGSQLLVATTDMDTNEAALVAVPVDPDLQPVVVQVLEQPVDGLNGLSWQTIGR